MIGTECQTESGIGHLEIAPQCATSIHSFAKRKSHRLHCGTLSVKLPPVRNESYELGGSIIDRIAENIPNIS